MRFEGEQVPFLLDEMAQDAHERLAFLRHEPSRVLVEGFDAGAISSGPWQTLPDITDIQQQDFDDPLPLSSATFDLVATINSLDTVNDLPGALIQIRELLVPGGLAIASFIGGASLGKLRRAMFDAEPDRPAARMHPLIDPRSCPQLLSRAGWSDSVVDSFPLTVRYGSLDRLVRDLREHAMGSALASPAPPLTHAGKKRAEQAFLDQADQDGKVSETFEIITLTGRRSLAGA